MLVLIVNETNIVTPLSVKGPFELLNEVLFLKITKEWWGKSLHRSYLAKQLGGLQYGLLIGFVGLVVLQFT
jgi:hypothetical protein